MNYQRFCLLVMLILAQQSMVVNCLATCRTVDTRTWYYLDSSRVEFVVESFNRVNDSLRSIGINGSRSLVDLSNFRYTFVFIFFVNRGVDSVICFKYPNQKLATYLLDKVKDSLRCVECTSSKSAIGRGVVYRWLRNRISNWTACDSSIDCLDLPRNSMLWPLSHTYFTVLIRYLFVESTTHDGLNTTTAVCCRFASRKGVESIRGPFNEVVNNLEQIHQRSLSSKR